MSFAANFFFDDRSWIFLGLASGLLLLVAYALGSGRTFITALLVLAAAAIAWWLFREPTPGGGDVGKLGTSAGGGNAGKLGIAISPGGGNVGKRGAPPRACTPTPRPAGHLALCGGIRMVRQGVCPYGWRTLWPEQALADSSPACPAPRAKRRRHDRFWDDCPSPWIPPPWFDPI